MHAPALPSRSRLLILLLALGTLLCRAEAQLPGGDYLALALVDPVTSLAPDTRAPFEIHLQGGAGLWVLIAGYAYVAPTAQTTLSQSAIDAFFALYPWAAPQLPVALGTASLVGATQALGVPLTTAAPLIAGAGIPGPAERERAQPLLAAAAG